MASLACGVSRKYVFVEFGGGDVVDGSAKRQAVFGAPSGQ